MQTTGTIKKESYAEKMEKAQEKMKTGPKKFKIGITGTYKPFRELICPRMTNTSTNRKDTYCLGPRCGHWNPRMNMCGTASIGEFVWIQLEYRKDYQATIEFYQKEEEHTITELRGKLDEINELSLKIAKELSIVDNEDCMSHVVWNRDNIDKLIKLSKKEEKENKEEKEEEEDECDPPISPFPIKPPILDTADQFTEAAEDIGRSHYGGEEK